MDFAKPIRLRGQILGGGKLPLVCAPLVAADADGLRAELAAVRAKAPDLIEWRVDFFAAITDTPAVLDALAELRAGAQGIPILFTRRSTREGGHATGLTEPQVLCLYEAVCDTGNVDFVDWELSGEPDLFRHVLAAARRSGAQLIASFHDFHKTPPKDDLVAKFVAMAEVGADIAKVAVMPQDMADVLVLFAATQEAHRRIALPIVSMAMGGHGSLSRMVGWAFGSSITFAVGSQASAPGQIPIEDLRQLLDAIRRGMGVQ
ncbi:MAG: type I 3-dehydroquinate dehydratase [Rhodocyclaceae bacterium]|nr:type I 3-dehydroquinate dehydratase [Rhodocyclaceae bacterium]MBX3667976.1 type I 3-dehydroquinate dehydratase [Rhodocyclaceae bacterium]